MGLWVSLRVVCTAGAAALVFAGCASAVYEDRYAWEDGWRQGEVIEVASVPDIERPMFYECVRKAGEGRGRFALVRYLQMGKAKTTAVPLSADQRVTAGKEVYVKLGDCRPESLAKRSP